ncbi:hypothetical protein [Vibrio breoganii]|nr:hypothetical protein [Vibrio breoganii]
MCWILTIGLIKSSIGAFEDDSIEFSDTYNEQRRAPRILSGI